MKNLRFWGMAILPLALLAWFWHRDPNDGAQLLTQLETLLGLLIVAFPVYLLRKMLMPGDSREAFAKAMDGNMPAAVVWLSLAVLTLGLLAIVSPRAIGAQSAQLPGSAARDLPILIQEIDLRWATLPMRSVLGAQVEQESGWKERATLKTSREEGVGYGQFTRAYRADGSLRFDALAEVRALDPGLAGWTWANRYDPRLQLRAVVVKNRGCYQRLRPLVADYYNALAMCDAAYNGGEGGVYAERRLCAAVAACDARLWFGHVEQHSTKSRAKWQGYGASAFEINRTHVRNVMLVRRGKYVAAMGT
ncbi:MAG: hypothetical protein HY847_01300 [Betaproteobacteria bacterium]|nr:hypothetical protein [Betaproteobacteria bacterium]